MTTPGLHLGFPSPSIADVDMAAWPTFPRLAEEHGFACLWHSNERFYREMFVRMTVSAMSTSRLQIGGAVAEPFAVHPAITAQSLATVAELSGGRASLALGAGGSGLPMMGVKRRRPAVALREAHEVLSRLLAGETVDFAGESVVARGARLHFPVDHRVPLWIATRGERTLEMAGRVADGVLIATHAVPRGVRHALELVERGAQRSGRRLGDLRLMTRVDTCVHEDAERAIEGSRLMVAKLLWMSYPDRAFVEAAGLEVPGELEAVIARRDYDALEAAAHLVTDDLIAAFCWAGTPADVAGRVVEIVRETGVTDVGFWLLRAPGQTLEQAVELLAAQVLPAVRGALGAATAAR